VEASQKENGETTSEPMWLEFSTHFLRRWGSLMLGLIGAFIAMISHRYLAFQVFDLASV